MFSVQCILPFAKKVTLSFYKIIFYKNIEAEKNMLLVIYMYSIQQVFGIGNTKHL